MRQRLFAAQRELGEAQFRTIATSLGLDVKAFDGCLGRPDMVVRLTDDVSEGRRLGVHATPTFFIGVVKGGGLINIRRALVGVPQYGTLKESIDALLSSEPAAER